MNGTRYFFVALAVLIMLGSQVETYEVMPGRTLVAVDPQRNIYSSPHCIQDSTDVLVMTVDEAETNGYQIDAYCREQGHFEGKSTSIVRYALQWIHLVPEKQSRWNPDGSWNW